MRPIPSYSAMNLTERNDNMHKFFFFTVQHFAVACALFCSASLHAQQASAPVKIQPEIATDIAAEGMASNTKNATSGIGYPTPQAALDALRKRKDINSRIQDKWLIVRDDANKVLWTFTPVDHPAYPAVIKRSLVNTDGHVQIETSALCQAKRAACDKMMADFKATDGKIRDSLKNSPSALVPAPTLPDKK